MPFPPCPPRPGGRDLLATISASCRPSRGRPPCGCRRWAPTRACARAV